MLMARVLGRFDDTKRIIIRSKKYQMLKIKQREFEEIPIIETK